MNTDRLKRWRAEIAQIDEQLVELIARRLEQAEKIGREKRRAGQPIRDWSVEKKVIERARRWAGDLDVPAGLVTAVMTRLIREACVRQEELPLAKENLSSDRVLIIGGKGRMGSWFARFFRHQGRETAILDPAGPLSGFQSFDDLADACRWATLILLAAPLAGSPGIYRKLIDRAPEGIICDIASIKSGLLQKIAEARKAGLRVASMHPLFGPETRVLSDKIICLCRCGDRDSLRRLRRILTETSARLVEVDIEHHDRLMSCVLGLSHLINIVFARTLTGSGLSYRELSQAASTTFVRQMETTRSVITENPDLYFEIQRANPHSAELFEQLRTAVDHVTAMITSQNLKGFRRIMEQGREYLETGEGGGDGVGEGVGEGEGKGKGDETVSPREADEPARRHRTDDRGEERS
jgi:chorismate mutase/prephenate dehydrogenase